MVQKFSLPFPQESATSCYREPRESTP